MAKLWITLCIIIFVSSLSIDFEAADLQSYFEKLKFEQQYTGSTLTHVLNGIKHGYKMETGRTLTTAFPTIGDFVKNLNWKKWCLKVSGS